MSETQVYDTGGGTDGTVTLPTQFRERVRDDIIKRAVESIQSKERQAYGADPEAGLKHVTYWKKRNRGYRSMRGRGYPSSRTPRKISFRRGMQMSGDAAEAPQAVGGRRAHPPKASKNFSKDINDKERRKGIRSAIAATSNLETVQERGHNVDDIDLPLVVSDEIESFERTSDVRELLSDLGLDDELERCSERTIRAGRGTGRGRKYKTKTGPLVVVAEDAGIGDAATNIPGVDVVTVENLNTAVLAPGTQPGRLTIWSKPAVQRLKDEGLFL